MSRSLLVTVHLIAGSFLFPVIAMYAVTGSLYTFKITGSYDSTQEILPISQPMEPDLTQLTEIARTELGKRGFNAPSGGAGIKRVGTSWQFEWTGSQMDFLLEPTGNPLELKMSFKKTTWHRFFVQLHKAKGGTAFKLLAALTGLGLLTLLVSGWLLGNALPHLKGLRWVSFLLGIATFFGLAVLS